MIAWIAVGVLAVICVVVSVHVARSERRHREARRRMWAPKGPSKWRGRI